MGEAQLPSGSAGGFYAYGEGGEAAELFAFSDDGVEVSEGVVDGDGVHLTGGIVAFFDQLLEVAAGNLYGEAVGDDLAGSLFLLDPRGAGQGDSHGSPADVEADVDCVGVAGGDGHDIGSPLAMEVFAGPAVGHVEVFVHGFSLSSPPLRGKDRGHAGAEGSVDCVLGPLVDW